MNPGKITDRLHETLDRLGFKFTIVSARHVSEMRETIEKNRVSGLIDGRLYRQYAGYFDNMLAQDVPWGRSIIVVAAPRPMLEVIFKIGGEKRSAIVPPVYEYSIDDTVAASIENELTPHGYRISRAALPLKLLAARSGLARYGKNNIAYVEGIGSFLRFIAFYTNLPAVKDTWQDLQVLDECSNCNACTKKCPTGAIAPDQFQLRAERCLTYHNESTEPFPQWIRQSWHHCLIGCLKCQHYCPVNRDVRSWTERFAEFTAEESALLLSGTSKEELPADLISKFDHTDFLDDPVGLARNLRSLLDFTH